MTYDITALGEILIDFTPHGTDENGDAVFIRKAGGAPLNLLAAAAKFGCRTAFIGKVGKDIHGAFLKRTVEKCGVKSFIAEDDTYNTTLAFVELDANGDRDFSFYRAHGADVMLDKSEVPTDVIESSRIFHFGSLSLISEPARTATAFALDAAKKAGCIITYDPNYRAPLWKNADIAAETMREYARYADMIKLSVEEACMITGKADADEALGSVAVMGAKVVLMTDGGKPVRYISNGGRSSVPASNVKAVDTTGAGDIFFGTFLTAFLRSGLPLDALNAANTRTMVEKAVDVAGRSTLEHGAIASIPNWD